MYTPSWNLKVHQLHEFAIFTSSQGGNERWQLISKFVQFTRVHFPDLNPNFYGSLKNVKLARFKLLAKCLHQGQILLLQMTRASLSLKIRVITASFYEFCSAFFKGHSPVQFYLRGDSSHIFKILILPNVRSTLYKC